MNGFQPTIGIEFDDRYINAKNKLIDFARALNDLSALQREQLAKECVTSIGMAASFEQFVSYMTQGGLR